MTFEQIKELIELVASHRLAGFEVEHSGFRLKIDGYPPAAAGMAVHHPVASAPAPAPSAPPAVAAPQAPPPAAVEAAVADSVQDAHVLSSPIVGTFYRSPSPDAPSFVEVGQRVQRGQVVCIVEAMKLMNEIESDLDGVIVKVYPKNAQPVEFGEPLFQIMP